MSGLAGNVTAHPDEEVRRALGKRVERLRKRRRCRASVGAVAVVVVALVIGGGGVVRLAGSDGRDGGPDTYTGTSDEQPPTGVYWPAPPPGDGELPAITIEDGDRVIDGLEIVSASERHGPADQRWPAEAYPYVPPHATQTFRQLGRYGGPTALVSSVGRCDPTRAAANTIGDCSEFWQEAPDPDLANVVEVGGRDAYLWQDVRGRDILHWTLPDQATVKVESFGLPAGDLLAFAIGLEPRRGQPGVTATTLPFGMTELPVDDLPDRFDARVAHYTSPAMPRGYPMVTIEVQRGGAGLFEEGAMDRGLGLARGEQVTVLGRPALLTRGLSTGPASVEHARWGWGRLPPAGAEAPATAASDGPPALPPDLPQPDVTFEPGDIEVWELEWRHTDDAVVSVDLYVMDRQQVGLLIDRFEELDESVWLALDPTVVRR